jgi:hypothetical protein
MSYRIPGLATATLFGLFAFAAPSARAQKPTPPDTSAAAAKATAAKTAAGTLAPGNACTINVDASKPVQPAPTPIILQATTTSAVGDSISASFPAESKITVVGVKPGAAPNSLELTLNTSQAVPGEWTIALKGSSGECTGKLKIDAAHQ